MQLMHTAYLTRLSPPGQALHALHHRSESRQGSGDSQMPKSIHEATKSDEEERCDGLRNDDEVCGGA